MIPGARVSFCNTLLSTVLRSASDAAVALAGSALMARCAAVPSPSKSSSGEGHGDFRALNSRQFSVPIISSDELFSRGEGPDQAGHRQVRHESDQTMPEEMRAYREDGTDLVINRAEDKRCQIHAGSNQQGEATDALLSGVDYSQDHYRE